MGVLRAKLRDVVDWVKPRLRPDVGVEVAVVELAEGLPAHDVGGVDGQPVVVCAHAVVAVLLPHRRHLPRLGAAEVLEGHGQLAQDAVPRLLQVAVCPPLFERPSLRRRVGRVRSCIRVGCITSLCMPNSRAASLKWMYHLLAAVRCPGRHRTNLYLFPLYVTEALSSSGWGTIKNASLTSMTCAP